MKLNALKILFVQTTNKSLFARDNDDPFIFRQVLFEELWAVPEAIEEGFLAYINRRTAEIEEALWYHARNCNSHCVICSDLESIGVSNEREEPRLCA